MKSLVWKFHWLSCHACVPSSILPSLCSIGQADITPAILLEIKDLLTTSDLLYSHKAASDLFCFQPTFIYRGCHGSSCYIHWRTQPQGQQSFSWRTAEPWHSRAMAQCSSQQSASLLGREISQNSTGEFPVQARIILSAFALISLPLFSLFLLGKKQISGRSQILHVNFSSKGETNSSMILVRVTPASRGWSFLIPAPFLLSSLISECLGLCEKK